MTVDLPGFTDRESNEGLTRAIINRLFTHDGSERNGLIASTIRYNPMLSLGNQSCPSLIPAYRRGLREKR
jgi:hypothetical protein